MTRNGAGQPAAYVGMARMEGQEVEASLSESSTHSA
jgi:hypothetical protein